MNQIHALLVGINQYHPESRVSALSGCENDIRHFHRYLTETHSERLSQATILLNQEATRENLISAFRNKLTNQAKKGDLVLFYYAGHGSREVSPKEFKSYTSEGRNETLVCYDSRLPGKHDLADRELGLLIDEAAQKGAEVVTILDCCHSGSGTRSLADLELGPARLYQEDKRGRTLASYLEGEIKTASEAVKNPRHILLAACDKREKAYELKSKNGLFSKKLLEVLQEHKGSVSYFDLFEECRLMMRKVSDKQNPQFETQGFFNGQNTFLQNISTASEAPFRVWYEEGQWRINAGAVHHLPTAKGKAAEFEIYRKGEFIDFGRVSQVQPAESIIDFTHSNKEEIFSARMTSLPTPKVLIELRGEVPALQEELVQALALFRPLFFELKTNVKADYALVAEDETTFKILNIKEDRVLRTVEGNNYPAVFEDLLEHCEKIARWEKSLDLDNAQSKFNQDSVELILREMEPDGTKGFPHKGSEVALDLFEFNGKAAQNIRFEVRNKHSRELYIALFYFSGKYGISPLFNDSIPADSTQILLDKSAKGNPLRLVLPEGTERSFDAYKILVSTNKIPDGLLRQRFFKQGETAEYWGVRSTESLKDARMLDEFDDIDLQTESNDWFAKTMRVECRRHQAQIGPKDIDLAQGNITVHAHKSFLCNAAFSEASAGSRSFGQYSFLSAFARKKNMELMCLTEGTRSSDNMNILEFNHIEHAESLKDNPLVIDVHQADDLIPAAYDGEFILPCGDIEKLPSGGTRVKVHEVPEEINSRSIGKALKMVFFKLALKKDTAKLAWVDYTNEQAERSDKNIDLKVEDAENILLCIHGIIGDTQGIADFARVLYTNQKPQSPDQFDLVLTFDYENLNTPIEQTAGLLKAALEEVGISETKKITILAHSMGGLVSRTFIEMLGGNSWVNRLVMAGTPNRGSNIGKIPNRRDKLLTLLGFAINILGEIPFAGKLIKILNGTQKVTVTLEQMDWEDEDKFLKNLAESGDPKVPYTTIAGFLDEFLEQNEDHNRLMNKLLAFGGRVFYKNEDNDLAVSIESIHGIPRNREPANIPLPAICHHMNYFTDGEVERAFPGTQEG